MHYERGVQMSDFLYARPNAITGIGSVVDLYGFLGAPNLSRTPEEADLMALRSDWMATGKDITRAMGSQQAR